MKLKLRAGVLSVVIGLLFISFKILEPELQAHHGTRETRDDQDYIAGDAVQSDVRHTSRSPVVPTTIRGSPLKRGSHDQTSRELEKASVIEQFLKMYDLDWDYQLDNSPWQIAAKWITHRRIHPESTPELGAILREMSEKPIVKVDVGIGGTQLKLTAWLEGGQKVAFKPKWMEREEVVTGSPYAGHDRHNGEIAAFHLNRLLGFGRAPLVVGRVVDLQKEIMPVAADRLLETFFKKGNNTCFYGKCYYCKTEDDGVCAQGSLLEGVIALWMPEIWKLKLWKHPWRRTYHKDKKMRWETQNNYCDMVEQTPPYDSGPILLDIIDTCVLDYIIGNADRHHYETFRGHDDSILIILDSAKSFGNPYTDERTILAPLYQCCRLRSSTWVRLEKLQNGVLAAVLRHILSRDPISPILTPLHYEALERRLTCIIDMVKNCIQQYGQEEVIIDDMYAHAPL